jgi:hypothetical protein
MPSFFGLVARFVRDLGCFCGFLVGAARRSRTRSFEASRYGRGFRRRRVPASAWKSWRRGRSGAGSGAGAPPWSNSADRHPAPAPRCSRGAESADCRDERPADNETEQETTSGDHGHRHQSRPLGRQYATAAACSTRLTSPQSRCFPHWTLLLVVESVNTFSRGVVTAGRPSGRRSPFMRPVRGWRHHLPLDLVPTDRSPSGPGGVVRGLHPHLVPRATVPGLFFRSGAHLFDGSS